MTKLDPAAKPPDPTESRLRAIWHSRILAGRVRKNALYSLIGFIITTVLLLASTPLLIHQLGTANYGLWTIALAAVGLMGALELGLGTAISKYVAEYTRRDDIDALSATVTAAFVAYTTIGLVLTIPIFLEAHRLTGLVKTGPVPVWRVDHVLRLVALGLIPLLLMSGSLAVVRGLQRFEIPVMVSIIQNLVTVVAAVGIASLGGSVDAVVLSSICVLWAVALASIVIAGLFLRRLGAKALLTAAHTKKTLAYVMYTGLSNLGSLIFGSVDRIAVGVVVGLRAVTYYVVSIGIANRLLFLADVLTSPLMPASSAALAARRPDIVRGYLKRATIAVAVMCLIFAVVVLVLSDAFMRLWLGDEFTNHALSLFRILVIVYALIAVAAPAYHIANGIGYAWLCASGALVGGAATIGLIFLLGRNLGLIGAAWANAAYLINLAIPLYVAATLSAQTRKATALLPLRQVDHEDPAAMSVPARGWPPV